MGAAIIPIVAMAVQLIRPEIPAIVLFVESLFGHSANPATPDKSGPVKKQTAVDILKAALTAMANAGRIPSAPVVDPSLPGELAGAVQDIVDAMKAKGLLAPPVPMVPGLAVVPLPGGPTTPIGPPIYLGPFVLR